VDARQGEILVAWWAPLGQESPLIISGEGNFRPLGRRNMRPAFSLVLAVAVALLVIAGVADAKPEQSPAEKSPSERLLEEARTLSLKGDFDGARQKLNAALQMDPKFWQAVYYRAELDFQQHRYETTLQDCAEILRMKPNQAGAVLLRVRVNAKLGRNDECLRELDQVIIHGNKKEPATLVQAYEMRAWLRATSPDADVRNGKQALSDAKEACKLSQDTDPMSLDAMAAAHAELGDFEAAVDAEDRAIKAQLVSDEFSMATQNVFQKHRASFKAHQPIRDE
jgi:tetratricopeptide (TPR) repeat protein